MIRNLRFALIGLLVTAGLAAAAPLPKSPAPRDKCPVCGMFVAKYPDFLGQLHFKDGTVAYFDGTKDLCKFYLDPAAFGSRLKRAEVMAVFVTDYYSLTAIDALPAFYVIGSDVYGPMGRELIPFAKEADAKEFMRDHKGKRILRFREITPAIVGSLD